MSFLDEYIDSKKFSVFSNKKKCNGLKKSCQKDKKVVLSEETLKGSSFKH